MIVCPECGTQNEAGARFCGNCGAYLAWEDAAESAEEQEAAEAARLEAEQAERERVEAEQAAEAARLEAERAAQAEREERERHEAERREAERLEAERREAERLEAERLEAERAEAERREEERREAERVEAERAAERERAEAEQTAEAERAEAERVERERAEAERAEAERVERERAEAERAEAERAERQRQAEERAAQQRAAEERRQEEARQAAEARRSAEARAREQAERAAAAKKTAEARLLATAMLKPVQPAERVAETPRGEGAPGDPSASGAAATAEPSTAEPRKPEARRPGRPAERPKPPPPPDDEEEPPPQPGDLICGECGAGNAPARKFCRRCGTSLQQASVVPALPWYRRIFRRKPKQPKAAGTRPVRTSRETSKAARFARRFAVLLVVVGALGAAAWFFRDPLQGAVGFVLDRVGTPAPVAATDVTASSQQRQHRAALTIDGFGNTYWRPAAEGSGVGEHLEYTFDEPFRLVAVLMIPGVDVEDQAAFVAEPRPEDVRITVTTADGDTVDQTWQLRDEPGDQETFVGVDDVVRVRLAIASTYGPSDRPVAVSEVEFYTRG